MHDRINTMDETQPLLRDTSSDGSDICDNALGKDFVDFDPLGDAENPRDWPKAYKWGIVALLAFMAFTVYVFGTLPSVTYLPALSANETPCVQNIHLHLRGSNREPHRVGPAWTRA